MAAEILVRNNAVEKFLEEVAREWRSLRPASYAAFTEIVKEESRQLIKPSAMSRGGHMLNFCKLPQDLYTFIKQQYRLRIEDVDFFADPANYYLLCRIWPDARIKRTPTNYLRIKDHRVR